MKKILIITILFFTIGLQISGCKINYRKNTNAYTLVRTLSKDSLYTRFYGYSIFERVKALNYYYFWREQPPKIAYWLIYNKKGPDYFEIKADNLQENLSILKQFDSVNYLKLHKEYMAKAYELIGIMRELEIGVVGAAGHSFSCNFNDSSHLSYIPNGYSINLSYYKNYKWIGNNFVLYY